MPLERFVSFVLSSLLTRIIGNSLQLLREIAQVILAHVLLLCEAGNCPDFHFDASVKLLAAHVPYTLIGQGCRLCL